MSSGHPPRKQLLLGAGSFADAESALKLIEVLGERMAADLCGLLTEMPVSGLSSQQVISITGQLSRAPTPEDAKRATQRDARAFRKRLALLAQSKMVEWSFEQRTGDLVACLCAAAQDWDLAVLGASPLHHRTGRVVCILPASSETLQMAETLAKALGTDLVSLSLSPGRGDEEFDSETALLNRLNRLNTAAVVSGWGAPFGSERGLRDLSSAARCPILVLRENAG